MKKYKIDYELERDDTSYLLNIVCVVHPFIQGVKHLAPENCYPDEGGEIEIAAILYNGEVWSGILSDKEEEEVEEWVFHIAQRDQEADFDEREYEDDRF